MEKRLQFLKDILHRATEHRKAVEAIIKKHGPRARIVSG
jgi:hypothetical protein